MRRSDPSAVRRLGLLAFGGLVFAGTSLTVSLPTARAVPATIVASLSVLPGPELGKIIETTLYLDNTGAVPGTQVRVTLTASDGTVDYGGADNDATCSGAGGTLTCVPYDGTLGTGNGKHWQHEVDPRAITVGADGRIVLSMVVSWTDADGNHTASSSASVGFTTPTPQPTPTATPTPTRAPSATPKPTSLTTAQPSQPRAATASAPVVATAAGVGAAGPTPNPTGSVGSATGLGGSSTGLPSPSAEAAGAAAPGPAGGAVRPTTLKDAVVPIFGASCIALVAIGGAEWRRRRSR